MSNTYNWATAGSDKFLAWAIPSLLVGTDHAVMDELAEATNKWSEVDLRITINGVEMEYSNFFESLRRNMLHFAHKHAEDQLQQNSNLTELEDLVAALQTRVRRAIVEAIAGTPLEGALDNDDRW